VIGPGRSAVTAAASGFAIAMALLGCGSPAPSPGGPSGVVSSPSHAPSSSVGQPPSDANGSPAASGGSIVVDDGLLALLPTQVDGVPLTPDAETAAELAADTALSTALTSVAVATAFGPVASDGSADYVVVTVVRLQPRTFSDGFFRDWRDSFDGAVCEQAGGVQGHAEAKIGEHPTWIGTCAGGTHTYHAVLQDDTVLVSLQGSGEGRFGEQVIAGLTE
jgi:hypothetical protein